MKLSRIGGAPLPPARRIAAAVLRLCLSLVLLLLQPLWMVGNKPRHTSVHRLASFSFLGPPLLLLLGVPSVSSSGFNPQQSPVPAAVRAERYAHDNHRSSYTQASAGRIMSEVSIGIGLASARDMRRYNTTKRKVHVHTAAVVYSNLSWTGRGNDPGRGSNDWTGSAAAFLEGLSGNDRSSEDHVRGTVSSTTCLHNTAGTSIFKFSKKEWLVEANAILVNEVPGKKEKQATCRLM